MSLKLLQVQWHAGIVISRPSKQIRSPYLADVQIQKTQKIELCHTPSLGCCGMVSTGNKVLLTELKSQTAKSKYSVDFSYHEETLVGINPNYGNKFAQICFENHFIQELPIFKEVHKEFTLGQSRFDFFAISDLNEKFIIEIKCVPLVENQSNKDTKKVFDFTQKNKTAIFPDGYRKSKEDTVSPWAVKHLNHLVELQKEGYKSVIVYFIQRDDCEYFSPYIEDKLYYQTFYNAQKKGLIILPYEIIWNNGEAFLGKKLKILNKIEQQQIHEKWIKFF